MDWQRFRRVINPDIFFFYINEAAPSAKIGPIDQMADYDIYKVASRRRRADIDINPLALQLNLTKVRPFLFLTRVSISLEYEGCGFCL